MNVRELLQMFMLAGQEPRMGIRHGVFVGKHRLNQGSVGRVRANGRGPWGGGLLPPRLYDATESHGKRNGGLPPPNGLGGQTIRIARKANH